jgi:hypothetical protein
VVSDLHCSQNPGHNKKGPRWSLILGTGDRDRRPGPAGDRIFVFSENTKCHQADSDEEDGWEEGSRDDQQNPEGDDDVEEVEASGSRASSKPILRLPERNDEDTDWTRTDGTKPASGKNKMPVEDMVRVRKHKELMRAEVDKNDIVHRWLRDHIKLDRWDKIAGAFPHGGKYSSKEQWVLMQEDAKSLFRYQQYGITVKLKDHALGK